MTTLPSPLLQKEMAGLDALMKVANQTAHGTANTRKAITHSFVDHMGAAKTPTIIIPVVQGQDTDTLDTIAPITVVKADSTTVTVKCSVASVPFDLYVG